MALFDPDQFPAPDLAYNKPKPKPKPKPIRYTPAQQRKRNLQKLADYLWKLPDDYEHFGMASYFRIYNEGEIWYLEPDYTEFVKVAKKPNECGTVACAAGHGIAAGVRMAKSDNLDWDNYAARAFTGSSVSLYTWLFSGMWESFDNTPKGAAERIYYYLENKTISTTNFFDPYRPHKVEKAYKNQQPVTWEGLLQ